MLAHCGTKDSQEGGSKKDQAAAKGKAAAQDGSTAEDGSPDVKAPPPPVFKSPELKAIQKISAVYTVQADVHYDWFKMSEDIPVKVLINHNGDDNNKQVIIRTERIGEPSADEKKSKGDQGFFCSLYTNFTIKQVPTSRKPIRSENIQSAGQLADVNKMILRIHYAKTLSPSLILGCTGRVICGDLTEPVKDVVKTSESLPSFDELYRSCFEDAKKST